MKIVVNRRPKFSEARHTFVGKRAMGSFATGIKRSVTVKSHSKSSYVVKSSIIK